MRETLIKTEEFKDSPVGKIPKHWDVVPLERVCLNVIDCPHTTPVFRNDGVLVARTSNIRNGNFDVLSASFVSEQEYRQRVARLEPQPGDVIFTREAPVGEAFIVPVGMRICLGQRTMLLRPDPAKAISSYVLAQIYSGAVRTRIEQLVAGTTNPHLNVADVRSFLIPVPTLQEQCRIAEILEAMDKAIAHTSSLIAKLKQMKAGLLHDLLTRGLDEDGELRDAIGHPEQFKDSPLGQIPEDWDVQSIGEISEVTKLAGYEFTNIIRYVEDGEIIALRALNIKNRKLDLTDIQRISKNTSDKLPRSKIYRGEVLITYIGAYIGDVLLIKESDKYHLAPNIAKLTAKDLVIPEFLELILQSEIIRKQMGQYTVTTATPSLTMTQIRALRIPLPTCKSEQSKIVSIFNTYDTRIRTEEAYREKLKLQKQGLMHDLLTGKVRVKNA